MANETKAIWQELYDRQREEVLKWPAQLPRSFRTQVESKQFGDEIDQLRPRTVSAPTSSAASTTCRKSSTPTNWTKAAAPGVAVGLAVEVVSSAAVADSGASARNVQLELDEFGNPIEVDYTVYWSKADQARIKAELDWPTTQSHWRIWVTQEDLWVYETMLRAVDATNDAKGADRQSNAAITDIGALQVGRDAAKESRTTGRIKRLQSGTSALIGRRGVWRRRDDGCCRRRGSSRVWRKRIWW